jgi:murein DD-endopeptidase MepM/ murein hydrolase activator NlpD
MNRSASTVYILATVLVSVIFTSCVATSDPVVKRARWLQRGKIKEDTSFVYSLPYPSAVRPLIVQGYFGMFTHKRRAALDFKMKEGTKIAAARGGVVTRMVESNDEGGGNRKYREFANYIVIQHVDGSRSGYWHLQQNGSFVNIGDTVQQGQVIGLSGKTGYAAIPHLHFVVWGPRGGRFQPIPTRFQTSKGVKYLRPWRRYRN